MRRDNELHAETLINVESDEKRMSLNFMPRSQRKQTKENLKKMQEFEDKIGTLNIRGLI